MAGLFLSLLWFCLGRLTTYGNFEFSSAADPAAGQSVGETPAETPTLRPLVLQLRSGRKPVAVMVENQVDARPPFGLEQAAVVYVTPAEGGITRFLAVFSLADLPSRIGPVRSVRPYFVDWAWEWRSVLLHSGGSPEALEMLKAGTLPDLNEISGDGQYYFRDSARARPHNLFTSAELIRDAFAHYRFATTVDFVVPPLVSDIPLAARPPAHFAVRIAALDDDYCVSYRYAPDQNAYARWQAGAPHQTADGNVLYAKSVIIQRTTAKVLDREGRLAINTVGGGPATVLTNGSVIPGTWRAAFGRTVFSDYFGNPIAITDGPLWIEVIVNPDSVTLFSTSTQQVNDPSNADCR